MRPAGHFKGRSRNQFPGRRLVSLCQPTPCPSPSQDRVPVTEEHPQPAGKWRLHLISKCSGNWEKARQGPGFWNSASVVTISGFPGPATKRALLGTGWNTDSCSGSTHCPPLGRGPSAQSPTLSLLAGHLILVPRSQDLASWGRGLCTYCSQENNWDLRNLKEKRQATRKPIQV